MDMCACKDSQKAHVHMYTLHATLFLCALSGCSCALMGSKGILPTDGAVVQVRHRHGWSARGARGIDFHLTKADVTELGMNSHTNYLPGGGGGGVGLLKTCPASLVEAPQDLPAKTTTPQTTRPKDQVDAVREGLVLSNDFRVLAHRPVASHRQGHVATDLHSDTPLNPQP